MRQVLQMIHMIGISSVSHFWNVIWPNKADRAAAARALWVGTLAAAIGAFIICFVTLKRLSQEGISISGVVLPICGGVLLGVAALGMHRRAPSSSSVAVIVWVVLGVAPIGVPLWLGLGVLLFLVSAARGSYVLRLLNSH